MAINRGSLCCLHVLTHEIALVRSFMPTSAKLAMLPPTMTLRPVQFAFLYPHCEKTGSLRTRGTHSKKVHSIPVTAWALLMTSLNPLGTPMHPVGMVAKLKLTQPTKLISVQALQRTTWAASGSLRVSQMKSVSGEQRNILGHQCGR
jgi:hypothetical protein